jgi:hypothetical protein
MMRVGAIAGIGAAVAVAACAAPATPERLSAGALHNVFRYADGVLGGSEPATDEDFATLATLGVKTIVSVDGARPKVETAAKHGLAYVHVPIGYDGVPEPARRQLVKTLRSVPGPIYVHCHHGVHRGPAAVGCMLVGDGRVEPAAALAMLKTVGTSPEYPGLYRDVAATRRFAAEELAAVPVPPPTASVSDFASAMAELDRAWDRIKLVQQAGWKADPKHPDLDPKHEAVMLHEFLAELRRTGKLSELNLQAAAARDFSRLLDETIQHAAELRTGLAEGLPPERLDAAFHALRRDCAGCHRRFRN